MFDPCRSNVLFQLLLDEQRAKMLEFRLDVPAFDRGPRWSAATAVAGRTLVRFGFWLQSFPHPPIPATIECACAGADC